MGKSIAILINLILAGIIYSNEPILPAYIHNTITPVSDSNAGRLSSFFEFAGNDHTSIVASVGVPKFGANAIFRVNGSNILGSSTFGEKSNTPVLYAPQLGVLFTQKINQGGLLHFGYLPHPQPGVRDTLDTVVNAPILNGLISGISWPYTLNNISDSGTDFITIGVYLPVNSSVVERISLFANSKFPLGSNSSLYWTANYDDITSSSLIVEMDTGVVSFLAGCDAMFELDRQTTLSRFIAIKVSFN